MKIRIFRFLSIIAVVLCATGCSKYSKLLKSKDHDKMFNEALKYYEAKKYNKTLALFEEIGPFFQGTLREDTIMFYTGASYYNQGDFESSEMVFDQFRRSFGRNNPFLEQAEYMYAMGFYYLSPQPERDQTVTIKAILAINEYMERYPQSVKKETLEAYIKELQRKLYDKEFINSKCYYTIGKYKSAVTALKNALDSSPESPHREEMVYLIAKSGYLLAHHSVDYLQRDRYLKMMDYYLNFASEYPDSKYINELDKMRDEAKEYLATHKTEEEKELEKELQNKEKISLDGTKKE